MTDYTLPHFGKVALQNLEEYYDVNIDFKGNEIQLDLNLKTQALICQTGQSKKLPGEY
jgi:hypothetical protein